MTDYIRHDKDKTHYSLTEGELNDITNKSQPLWKDICLISFSVGIPTLINAITGTVLQETFILTLPLFLNYLFGVIGILSGVIFSIAWRKSHTDTDELIEKIKAKPKMELNVGTSDVGALEELEKTIKKLAEKPAKYS